MEGEGGREFAIRRAVGLLDQGAADPDVADQPEQDNDECDQREDPEVGRGQEPRQSDRPEQRDPARRDRADDQLGDGTDAERGDVVERDGCGKPTGIRADDRPAAAGCRQSKLLIGV